MQNCLECGEKIMGRIDKKFCSDACRNAYNNKQNKDQTNLMRNINNKLRKNFKILSEQNFVENKAKTTRNKLSVAGFDFEYFTNIKTYKNGAQYYFVYDFGYKFLEEDFILVVKKEKKKRAEISALFVLFFVDESDFVFQNFYDLVFI